MPHVGMVDSGPKVICAVWREKMALKHTNTCTGYITTEAHKSVRQRHANQGGSWIEVRRVVCELWWMDLTTCDVSASPKAVICQMHAKEMIYIPNDGMNIHIRCGGWSRQLKNKNDVPYGRWPENPHEWQ